MAILATFNIADLSRYVKDCFEDPSNLRSNPFEGEVTVGHDTKESFEDPIHAEDVI